MNKKIVLLSLLYFIAPNISQAEQVVAVGDIPTKKVLGYDVLCQAENDVYWQMTHSKHKAYNFCSEAATNLILSVAKTIPKPNFGGDLKLLYVAPYVDGKPQEDYKLVVIVDEVAKKIIPDPTVYVNQKYLDKGMGLPSTGPGYGSPVGMLYAEPNSLMYCFKNPSVGYIGYQSVYPSENRPVCSYYQGTSSDTNRPEFMVMADAKYNIFKGTTPEKTKEFESNHRTAKMLVSNASKK